MPGASVTAQNEATGAKFDTVTSTAGLFSFPNLLAGSYTVTVELSGFKKFVRKNVPVSANQVIESNATLEVGEVSTTIEVIGGAELYLRQAPRWVRRSRQEPFLICPIQFWGAAH